MRTPKEIDVTTSEPSARASRLPTGVRPRARMRGLEEWAWGHAAEAGFFFISSHNGRVRGQSASLPANVAHSQQALLPGSTTPPAADSPAVDLLASPGNRSAARARARR